MTPLESAYRGEIAAFAAAERGGDAALAWTSLERAHILSQRRLMLHLDVHAVMLGFALRRREWGEVGGQVLRLLLAPLGALLGRIPIGNTGRANVSAFTPMAVPEDLRAVLAAAEQA